MLKMRKRLNQSISLACVVMLTVTLLTVPTQAFTGRDGNEIISCTKLTEPFAILDVASQGGTNFGKYYVQTITGGANFYLYDIDSNSLIATIPFTGDGSAYKNNNANFGTEYYDPADPLPLLYVSSAYDYRIHVFRIYKVGSVWKAAVVQKISYPTINNANGFYSCNVLLDNDNGFLYLTPLSYIFTTLENEQHFYKFKMPKLADGNVELKITDAIDHCSVWDYIHAPQGAIIKDNKVYQLHGVSNAFLRVFDLTQKKYVKTYQLFNYGYNMEPESIGYYNGNFYSMDDSLEVWKISIQEADPIIQDVGTSKTVKLTNWEAGSVNPATGNESTSTKIARMADPVLTLGADKLIIETPKHHKGKTTDGTFYKWRVIWFKGSTCLGLASEQCDFTTFTEFAVPKEADSFRLAIADVYGGKTQSTFPVSKFISDGGMKVKLFTIDDTPNNEGEVIKALNEWEMGSFYADGTENNKTQIARTTDCISTFGANKLTVDMPVHWSGASTPKTYYKWCVQWYNGDICLGLASEQEDFATVAEYVVPENADRFRMKIASVVNGTTETTFPLAKFNANACLNISLSGVSKTTVILSDWEIGSMSPVTGEENTLTRIARTTGYVPVHGASELYIEPLVHYSGQTTAGTYYKWRVIWFNGSTCLGIASEQADFSTETDFLVPANADSFRLMIASVVDGITEDPFPLNTFIANGGIGINLIMS